MSHGLPAFALFAAALASAGLPIYIHAPKFFADNYGVELSAIGAALFGLRLLDVVQDPVLGWLSRVAQRWRSASVTIAAAIMALSMFALFAVAPPVAPLLWFAVTLALLFSSFSFLTITFYSTGVRKAQELGEGGHVRLAAWRETGALIGVCAASVLPTLFALTSEAPFTLFAIAFVVLTCGSVWAMRGMWASAPVTGSASFGVVLRDPLARRLLLIAVLNSAPVAVTSTLFLFFVEARIGAEGWEGPLLLLFFLSAAIAAPAWGRAASRFGSKKVLQSGMVLAIATFSIAIFLQDGDLWIFALVCILSGAALGADMTLLPALFAARMEVIVPDAAEGFGLWSFASKMTLALAAAVLLPLLDASGYSTTLDQQPDTALWTLTLLYAAVPLVMKALALALLTLTPLSSAIGTEQS